MHSRLQRLGERTNGYTVTPRQFVYFAYAGLAALTLIVLTGAAVRLTGSGLGCPTWPKCYGNLYPPLKTHALIEFSNRVISVPVVLAAGFAWLAALRRRPYRRDLMRLAALLPLGVVAQAVLGGLTVRGKLDYGWVMGHFALSMLILVAAVALAWGARSAAGEQAPAADRAPAAEQTPAAAREYTDPAIVKGLWALVGLGALTIFAGTAATAAGPHSGGNVGQHIKRLTIEGPDTLEWAVHQHATIAAVLGVFVILVWLLKRSRTGGALDPLEPLTVLGVLIAAQGLVGSVQYELRLPAEMVWVHVVLATLTWLVMLWAVAVEGRIGQPETVANEEAIATIVAEWSRSVPAS